MRLAGFVFVLVMALPASAFACDVDASLEDAAVRLIVRGGFDDADALLAEARSSGSTATAVYALSVAAGDDATVDQWLARLARRVDAPLVCGSAESEGRKLVLAAAHGGALSYDPPNARIRVVISEGFRAPHLVLRGANGALVRVRVDADVLARGAPLPEALELPVDVQLVAEGRSGPHPMATLRIGEGRTPSVVDGESNVERGVAALRSAHEASPLRTNRILSAEAGAHALRVCRLSQVAHRGVDGEDPEQRLRRRGLAARVVGETVARARTPSEALSALESSPSHLMTLVDRRFTDGGFGMASDGEGHVCVVVLLAAWPRMTAD